MQHHYFTVTLKVAPDMERLEAFFDDCLHTQCRNLHKLMFDSLGHLDEQDIINRVALAFGFENIVHQESTRQYWTTYPMTSEGPVTAKARRCTLHSHGHEANKHSYVWVAGHSNYTYGTGECSVHKAYLHDSYPGPVWWRKLKGKLS